MAIPNFRILAARILSLQLPTTAWKAIAILLILSNLKNLPLVWHFRFLWGLYYHIYNPNGIRKNAGPKLLFQPVITASRAPLYECDLYRHKSNSTYFSDLDIARTHCFAALTRHGLQAKFEGANRVPDGPVGFALGGVSCVFKREIKPYKAYEIWTRILTWDQKWIYTVSHFVEKGTIRPASYTLQPNRGLPSAGWLSSLLGTGQRRGPKPQGDNQAASTNGSAASVPAVKVPNRAIHASSIAKYVLKRGRLTIVPATFFERSGLLPPKPDEVAEPPPAPITAETAVDESLLPGPLDLGTDGLPWTWQRVEAERARGMQIAKLMAGLDVLHNEFSGAEGPALGQYLDLPM
ncbi:MAG: hypothetical protein M1829_000078 [Trizodia sp. TS-e1964]|nr:MAG: hypothetical protein M1829_000078 [Trizodia sp. TS-e1964]